MVLPLYFLPRELASDHWYGHESAKLARYESQHEVVGQIHRMTCIRDLFLQTCLHTALMPFAIRTFCQPSPLRHVPIHATQMMRLPQPRRICQIESSLHLTVSAPSLPVLEFVPVRLRIGLTTSHLLSESRHRGNRVHPRRSKVPLAPGGAYSPCRQFSEADLVRRKHRTSRTQNRGSIKRHRNEQ
jgi:hypothetical protein